MAINDPANQNEPVYYPTGPSNTKGIEAAFVRDQLSALKVPAKIVDTG